MGRRTNGGRRRGLVRRAHAHPNLDRQALWRISPYRSFGWADLVVCPPAGPTVEQHIRAGLPRRLKAATPDERRPDDAPADLVYGARKMEPR
jgi:hypothetical protein